MDTLVAMFAVSYSREGWKQDCDNQPRTFGIIRGDPGRHFVIGNLLLSFSTNLSPRAPSC